jgi:hypothetical protein
MKRFLRSGMALMSAAALLQPSFVVMASAQQAPRW